MDAYSVLAEYYDSLTTDVPYGQFADFYESLLKLYGVEAKTVLDLACGTGAMTYLLAERGFEMIGVDSSSDMLSVAAQKSVTQKSEAQKSGNTPIQPVFICQRMEELDLYGTVDAAICTLDGMNNIHPKSIKEVFRRVHLFLEPGGLFIFDINTPLKLRNMDGAIYLDETEDVFCVWRNEFIESENLCRFAIDIFAKTGELWKRGSEDQVQYAHSPGELAQLLEEVGFTDVRVMGELTVSVPSPDEQRVFIAAQKE